MLSQPIGLIVELLFTLGALFLARVGNPHMRSSMASPTERGLTLSISTYFAPGPPVSGKMSPL